MRAFRVVLALVLVIGCGGSSEEAPGTIALRVEAPIAFSCSELAWGAFCSTADDGAAFSDPLIPTQSFPCPDDPLPIEAGETVISTVELPPEDECLVKVTVDTVDERCAGVAVFPSRTADGVALIPELTCWSTEPIAGGNVELRYMAPLTAYCGTAEYEVSCDEPEEGGVNVGPVTISGTACHSAVPLIAGETVNHVFDLPIASCIANIRIETDDALCMGSKVLKPTVDEREVVTIALQCEPVDQI